MMFECLPRCGPAGGFATVAPLTRRVRLPTGPRFPIPSFRPGTEWPPAKRA